MNTVNLNHPDTILGPFKNFVHIASSAELAGGGVSDFATRVASIGKLLETTLALRAHYVSFPRVRLTDGSSVSEDQLELVLMHENARVKFKQSLIRLEDELEQLKARQLKSLLEDRGLDTRGKKIALVERLLQAGDAM